MMVDCFTICQLNDVASMLFGESYALLETRCGTAMRMFVHDSSARSRTMRFAMLEYEAATERQQAAGRRQRGKRVDTRNGQKGRTVSKAFTDAETSVVSLRMRRLFYGQPQPVRAFSGPLYRITRAWAVFLPRAEGSCLIWPFSVFLCFFLLETLIWSR